MEGEWLAAREFRRLLRRRSTDAEARLWRFLRSRGVGAKFRRQHSVAGYTLDFFSVEAMVAVEVDGGQHFEEAHRERDAERDVALAARGIEVLRFTDREVLLELEAVGEVIWRSVRRRSAELGPAPKEP